MIMKTRFLLIISGVIALIGITSAIVWRQSGDRPLQRAITGNAELLKLFSEAKTAEAEIAADPEKVRRYFDAGLAWKSIGELATTTSPLPYFRRSLAVYEKGIVKYGEQNILFYLNAAKLAERLEDFSKAERYFRKAIEISPADESSYLALAEMLDYRLHRPKEQVVAVLNSGLNKMLNPTPLIIARAEYLRRRGFYAEALSDYRTLTANFPRYAGYQLIIKELEEILKSK